jgi:hypothetical protein
MKSAVTCLALFALLVPVSALAQPGVTTPNCPIAFRSFNPNGLSMHIVNTSGKTIVGLTFVAALADATEHWKWLHWNFDDARPLREFGWNKTISPGAKKTLSWAFNNLDFQHGGGGAFVLTSVLFEDGTSWEDTNTSECRALWINAHKKNFTRPINLPPRPPSSAFD